MKLASDHCGVSLVAGVLRVGHVAWPAVMHKIVISNIMLNFFFLNGV